MGLSLFSTSFWGNTEQKFDVPALNGAISVLVGQGYDANDNPTGGLPYEALDPSTGGKLLCFKLDDQTVPQEDVRIVSTPFTYFAQYAMQLKNKITSDQVLDGTLAVADLSSEVLDLINQGKSEPTLPIAAKYVSINGSLTYASGSDVQEVVRGFDNTLGVQDRRIKKIEDRLPPGTDTFDDRYVNVTGDTMKGNLHMENANITLTDGNTVDGYDISKMFGGLPPDGPSLPNTFVFRKGDVMTGNLTAPAFNGDGAGLINLNGGNIQNDTVTTDQIKNGTIKLEDLAFGFNGWDTDASDDLITTTQFGGQVTGTYDNMQVKIGGKRSPNPICPSA